MRLVRRRRASCLGRIATIAALSIVLVAGLVVAAGEIFARPAAERAVAEQVQAHYRLAKTPDVHVHGFPFALAAVRGNVPRIDAQLSDFTYDGLAIRHAEVALRDVRFRLGRDYAETDGGTARVTVGDAELSEYLRRFGLRAAIEIRPDGVTVRGRVAVAGFSGEVVGTGRAAIAAGSLQVAIDDVTVNGQSVSPALSSLVRGALSFTVPLPQFFDVAVDSLALEPGAARFGASIGPQVLRRRPG